MIGWVVITLSHRQANRCLSMPQPWPRVKVTERSPSTFSQTFIFFGPWEPKVMAAADADAAAETNWKHKVAPDWGELIIFLHHGCAKSNSRQIQMLITLITLLSIAQTWPNLEMLWKLLLVMSAFYIQMIITKNNPALNNEWLQSTDYVKMVKNSYMAEFHPKY